LLRMRVAWRSVQRTDRSLSSVHTFAFRRAEMAISAIFGHPFAAPHDLAIEGIGDGCGIDRSLRLASRRMSKRTTVIVRFCLLLQAMHPGLVVTCPGCWRILAAFQLFTCQRKPLQKLGRVANGNETRESVKGVECLWGGFLCRNHTPGGPHPADPRPSADSTAGPGEL
jgi:hypothetical protein